MDWVAAMNVAGPVGGLLIGGLFGRRKTKADAHSMVVSDAVTMAQKAEDRADRVNIRLNDALVRIDSLEEREARRDQLARQHLRWDWRQVRNLADLGVEVEDPPPLFIYDDNEPTRGN
jgi:hypothetical protein